MSNFNPEDINQAKNQLENARNILLALPANPNIDNVAGALTLYLSLSAAGKQISLISPTEMTVNYNHLIGVDKISTELNSQSGRNLIISFPYAEGSIEKVSYNIENETFNLVIEPRDGYPAILPEMMRYSFSNGNLDCIVTIGCKQPEELGQFYLSNRNLFSEKPVINIDINSNNANFGKVNLVDTTLSSVSELILNLMEQMGLTIEADMATNLLAGVTAETDNFSSAKTTASTFETAAMLLKMGAKKLHIQEKPAVKFPQPASQNKMQDQTVMSKSYSQFGQNMRPPFGKQPTQTQQPGFFKPRTPNNNQPQITQQTQKPFAKPGFAQPPRQQQPSAHEISKPPETPPDWLKPKIYKGSTLL